MTTCSTSVEGGLANGGACEEGRTVQRSDDPMRPRPPGTPSGASQPRLLYVVTHAASASVLLRGQLAWMRDRGYDVAVVASPGPELDVVAGREGVDVFGARLSREIALWEDAKALRDIHQIVRLWRPDIVYAATPKGGLLGMVASWICRVPARVYGQWGLRLETTRGLKRLLLWSTERVACALAHRVHAAGPSLASRCINLGLVRGERVFVAGDGSTNGVDPERFSTTPEDRPGPLRGACVIGFVGRITRDKGVVELVDAFERVHRQIPRARLLLVGDFEAGDPVPVRTAETIRRHPAILQAGFVRDVARYYGWMDVLAFPSHREGFPNAPLEAAASGLPVVGFRATGVADAVQDGVTGTLLNVGDVGGLERSLIAYLNDPLLRHRHGRAGRARVGGLFGPERVWGALAREFEDLLCAAGRPLPSPTLRANPRPSAQ